MLYMLNSSSSKGKLEIQIDTFLTLILQFIIKVPTERLFSSSMTKSGDILSAAALQKAKRPTRQQYLQGKSCMTLKNFVLKLQ